MLLVGLFLVASVVAGWVWTRVARAHAGPGRAILQALDEEAEESDGFKPAGKVLVQEYKVGSPASRPQDSDMIPLKIQGIEICLPGNATSLYVRAGEVLATRYGPDPPVSLTVHCPGAQFRMDTKPWDCFRDALTDTDTRPIQEGLVRALRLPKQAERIVSAAKARLLKLTAEQLFREVLKADRAALEADTNEVEAAKAGLLFAIRRFVWGPHRKAIRLAGSSGAVYITYSYSDSHSGRAAYHVSAFTPAEKPLWQGYYVVQRATTLDDGGMTLIRRMLAPSVVKEPGKEKRGQEPPAATE